MFSPVGVWPLFEFEIWIAVEIGLTAVIVASNSVGRNQSASSGFE